ncbi:hypothetical protein CN168_33785 [Sinorhizobium medicae]|nr:hypothetical protein CN168_33785 [Sinorhizobium medicae]
MSHLPHRSSRNPNRHDDLALFFVAPSPPPFLPKNFHAHRNTRLRHVPNDVVKQCLRPSKPTGGRSQSGGYPALEMEQ